MPPITTIQVEKSTRKHLERFRQYRRETFDEIINKLIKLAESSGKKKLTEDLEPYLLSEKALGKVWLSKAEDEAWRDL